MRLNQGSFLHPFCRVALCFAALTLCLLIWLCTKLILANAYLQAAQKIGDSGEQGTANLRIEDFERADSLLEKSGYWQKNHPLSLHYQSSLDYQLWKIQPDSTSAEQSPTLQNALIALDEAIETRPRWPLFYVQKTIIYTEYSNLGQDFYHAFDAAFQLGRYERHAALALLKVGLNNWYRLPETYQSKVVELMHLSLQQKSNSAPMLWHLIDQKNLGSWFCYQLPLSPRYEQLCSNRVL